MTSLIEQLRKPVAIKFDDHDAVEAVVTELYQRGRLAADRIEELEKQLAASQAREVQLREALNTYIDEHEECADADDWMAMMCSVEAHHVADEALALPQDTTALDSLIAKTCEVMRERCAKEGWTASDTHCEDYVAASIRTLPGVTLEDLKK